MGGFVLDRKGVWPEFLPESQVLLNFESFSFLLDYTSERYFDFEQGLCEDREKYENELNQTQIKSHAQYLPRSDMTVWLYLRVKSQIRAKPVVSQNL